MPGQQKPCHLSSLDLTHLQPSGDTAYLMIHRGAFYTRYLWLGPDSGTELLLPGVGWGAWLGQCHRAYPA